MDLGATPTRTFFKVTLPLIMPGILAAFLLSFALSIDDFIITYFVSGTEHEHVPGADLRAVARRDAAADQRARVDDPVRQHRRARDREPGWAQRRQRRLGADADMGRRASVQHWIDGKPWDGAPARVGRRLRSRRPARSPARSRSPGPTEIDAAVAGARQRVAASGARRPLGTAGRDPLRVPRAARGAQGRAGRGSISAEHGKVRVRRARRDRAGPGGRGVRVRDPAPAEGRVLGVGLDRHRRPLDPPAARRGRRASRRSTSRRWSRCGCTRSRSRAATRSCSSRASAIRRRRTGSRSCGRRPGCRPACSPCCTATRRRSTVCSPTPTSGP